MAVLEGGVSGFLVGRRPQTLKVLRASTLCCADDKVSLDAAHRIAFAPLLIGLASSSMFKSYVSAPLIVVMASSLWRW
jgi:hypothetical protein